MDVLRGWSGRWVTVIAFVEPGVSLRPLIGFLAAEDGAGHIFRARIEPGSTRIAFPLGTFHGAGWVPGQEGRGLSIEQGATRIDVFVEED